jgi:hypothetical protein
MKTLVLQRRRYSFTLFMRFFKRDHGLRVSVRQPISPSTPVNEFRLIKFGHGSTQ